jgi:hypothetical protein
MSESDNGVGVATTMIGVGLGLGSDVGSGGWRQLAIKSSNSGNRKYLLNFDRILMEDPFFARA